MPTRLRQYRPFEKARAYAHGLKLKSGNEWKQFTKSGKLPKGIPSAPQGTYADKGWGDFLGTGAIALFNREFRSFETARAFAHGLGFKSRAEWWELSKERKLPNDIPSYPNETYAGASQMGQEQIKWVRTHCFRYRRKVDAGATSRTK